MPSEVILNPAWIADWDRTMEVLERAAGGTASRLIASEMHVSHQSVDYHLAKLMRIMGVQSRTAVVAKAYAIRLLGGWPPRLNQDVVKAFITQVDPKYPMEER